jgi:hypothetical protein
MCYAQIPICRQPWILYPNKIQLCCWDSEGQQQSIAGQSVRQFVGSNQTLALVEEEASFQNI